MGAGSGLQKSHFHVISMVPLPGGKGNVMSFVALERGADTPLTHQIYERLRTQILRGALPSGVRMTSTRRLCGELGVSRNIVLNAFDQLLAEGYIETRVGAGTFVSSGAAFRPKDLPGPSLHPECGLSAVSPRADRLPLRLAGPCAVSRQDVGAVEPADVGQRDAAGPQLQPARGEA